MGGIIVKETPTVFAHRIGCAKSYITQLKKDDRLVIEPKGKRWVVLVEASFKRLAETKGKARDDVSERWEQQRSGALAAEDPQVSETDQVALESKQQSIAKSERFKALKLEAEYRIMAGELVEVAQVQKAWVDAWTHLRSSMDNLQDRLSSEMASESDPERIYALLGEHFELTLDEVSRQLKAMGDKV